MDTCHLLDSLRDLFDCQMTFSSILPQLGDMFRAGISAINIQIFEHCHANGYELLLPSPFIERSRGRLNERLYAKDGIHAGKLGIETLYSYLADHLQMSNLYMK